MPCKKCALNFKGDILKKAKKTGYFQIIASTVLIVFSRLYQTVTIETMTVEKFRLQFWLYISKYYERTKLSVFIFFVYEHLKSQNVNISRNK